jgi:L-arginine dehydrogenase
MLGVHAPVHATALLPAAMSGHPIPILEASDVAALLERIDVVETMRALFLALGTTRAAQPPQTLTLFPGGGGDFITYLGALDSAGVFGAKLSPYIVRSGAPLITAWTTLMSMDTGRPVLLCDAGQLTTERTGATTALAVDELARDGATRLAVVGAGPIARAHIRHTRDLRDWRDIRVYSRSLTAHPATQATLQAMDSRIHIHHDLFAAVHDADVVMLCTSSATPVLDPAMLDRPALITSVSTNAPRAHEIPPEALLSMDVYCDDRHGTPRSAGEMHIAAEEFGWSAGDIVGDLSQLVTMQVTPVLSDTHLFFRSIGLGLEDIAMAKAIADLLAHAPH